MPNVLISNEIGSEWRTILGHASWLSTWVGYVCFGHSAWIRTNGFRRYLQTVKKIMWKFPYKFNQSTWPWMAFAWNFFVISLRKTLLRGSVGQIIYREYIVFRGSNISYSLACISEQSVLLQPGYVPFCVFRQLIWILTCVPSKAVLAVKGQ